jgi:hypothetical protein
MTPNDPGYNFGGMAALVSGARGPVQLSSEPSRESGIIFLFLER